MKGVVGGAAMTGAAVDPGRLRVDPEVAHLLGERGVAAAAALIEPLGDCWVCHQPLGGDVPLSLTARRRRLVADQEQVVVLPAHAACAPSRVKADSAYPPASTYKIGAVLLPAQQEKVRGPLHRRRMQTGWVPTVLINPSADVQVGRIVEGQWQARLDSDGLDELLKTTRLSPQQPLPPAATTWGAELNQGSKDSPALTLTDPARQSYQVSVVYQPFVEAVHGAGAVLVLVSDVLRVNAVIGDAGRVDSGAIADAIEAGVVLGAWAELGAAPAPIHVPERGDPPGGIPANATKPSTVEEMHKEADDVRVAARASFADHPAVGLDPLVPKTVGLAGQRLPVLLLEPYRIIVVTNRRTGEFEHEIRVENAVGLGLQRLAPGVSLLDVARDWTVHQNGRQVSLRAPFDQVVAETELRFPPAWLAAAEAVGHVLVIYGPEVGVRPRAGARSYNDDDRRAELHRSRRAGMAAWGLVRWLARRSHTR